MACGGLILLASSACAGTAPPAVAQINLPRIDALPSDGGPGWRLADWRGTALAQHDWLYAERPNGTVFSIPGRRGRWFNGTVPVSIPSYLGLVGQCGGTSSEPGEALAVVGAVYGSAVAGVWGIGGGTHASSNSSDGGGGAGVDPSFIKLYAGKDGIVWNNAPGLASASFVPSFWYSLMNHWLLFGALDALGAARRDAALGAARAATPTRQTEAAALCQAGRVSAGARPPCRHTRAPAPWRRPHPLVDAGPCSLNL